jgi:hypothetical protein
MIRQPGANANPYVAIIMLTGHSEKKRVTAAREPPEHQFELYRPRSGAEAARPTSSDKRLCWKKPAPRLTKVRRHASLER